MKQFHPLEMLASILGTNPRLFKEIDKEYEKKKWEYYESGKKSFPDSKLLNRYTLIQDDHIRKSLGILMYHLDRQQTEIPLRIIKKGYKIAYHYALTKPHPNLEEFYLHYIKKNGGLEKIKEIDLHNESIILVSLCSILKKNIDANSPIGEMVSNHIRRLHNDTMGSDRKFYLNHFSAQDGASDAIQKYLRVPTEDNLDIMLWIENEILKITDERMLAEFGDMGTVEDLSNVRYKVFQEGWVKFLGFYSAMVKTSGFDENTFFDDFVLSKEDIKLYMTYLAVGVHENDLKVSDMNQAFIGVIYIKAILKEYKKAKDYVLNHQQDDFFHEINEQAKLLEEKEEEFKKREKELEEENRLLREKVIRMEKTVGSLQAENKRMKDERKENHQNQKELIALRNYAYRKQNVDAEAEVEVENPLKQLSVVKGAVVGGHVNWHNKMKRHLTHFRFIGPDSLNLDFSFIRNLDVVYMNTSYANHPLFRKMMKEVEASDAKLVFLDVTNEYITFKEMVEGLEELSS